MTMTDPIADMLTRLRNANAAYHDAARMPSSKLKTHIAEILQQEGYIAGWRVDEVEKDGHTFKELVVDLKYGPNRRAARREQVLLVAEGPARTTTTGAPPIVERPTHEACGTAAREARHP